MQKMFLTFGLVGILILSLVAAYSVIGQGTSSASMEAGSSYMTTLSPSPTCLPGETNCGNKKCCTPNEACKSKFILIYGTVYWCNPKTCPPGTTKCGNSGYTPCCKSTEVCMSESVLGQPVYKCGQNQCAAGETECGTHSGGKLCCNSNQECKSKSGVHWCDAKNCPTGQTKCSGDNINICCSSATQQCGNHPDGSPRCIPKTPPTTQPTSTAVPAEPMGSEVTEVDTYC